MTPVEKLTDGIVTLNETEPIGHRIERMSSDERRDYLRELLEKVWAPQRDRLIGYAATTKQSAQVDSDGYLAQIIASIVTGVPGNFRRGKSGSFAGDLLDGTEVKGAYRIEQMNGMEDSHVNFGQITREKMLQFMDRDRAIIVHISYDELDRPKIEVLLLPLREEIFTDAVTAFHARSSAERPQLQPRLYPDGVRSRLQTRLGNFQSLGARLLARAVLVGDSVVVDKWSPDAGVDLSECLDIAPLGSGVRTNPSILDTNDPSEFFVECMVKYRHAIAPFCAATGSSQNVGFGNLAQHLVSVVTGIPGTGSGARGFDLIDTSEIKLAMGRRGDPLGTEDFPRLNLGNNVAKMLSWASLYAVRIVCDDEGLKVKVMRPDTLTFRAQVIDYFHADSRYASSANLQYHAPKQFDSNVFTGISGIGLPRLLTCAVLFEADETRTQGDKP